MFVDLSSKREGVPPPDPHLLALHAACARTAHLAGAIISLHKLEEESDEIARQEHPEWDLYWV